MELSWFRSKGYFPTEPRQQDYDDNFNGETVSNGNYR